jgi:hypothetical protein
MVKAEIDGKEITFEAGIWETADPDLKVAAGLYERQYYLESSGVYEPDRDKAVVDYVVEQIGGRVISFDEVDAVPGRVY